MATHGSPHVAGHTPFRKSGWGYALFIVALAAGCWATAWIVKERTYLHPRDPRWQAIEPQHHEPAPAAAAGHGAPAATDAHGAAAPAGGGH